MGVKGDVITHTSDHFDYLYEMAIKLIKSGNAYADDTEQMQVRFQSQSSHFFSNLAQLLHSLGGIDAGGAYGWHCVDAARSDRGGESRALFGDEDGLGGGPTLVHPGKDERGQPQQGDARSRHLPL